MILHLIYSWNLNQILSETEFYKDRVSLSTLAQFASFINFTKNVHTGVFWPETTENEVRILKNFVVRYGEKLKVSFEKIITLLK